MMKIAFTILCHNYGRFLAQAIDSCLAQQAPGWEVETWVMDDASTDNTAEVCASYAGGIRVSRSDTNLGFGATLGRCVSEPDADFIALLDADDWCQPGRLAAIAPHLEAGAVCVKHRMLAADEAGTLLPQPPLLGATSAICIDRRAALTVLPVRNEVSFYSLLHGGRGVEIGEALVCYRLHGQSMQRAKDQAKWREELANVYAEYLIQVERQLDEPPSWLADRDALREWTWEVLMHMHFARVEASLLEGKRLQAFQHMLAHWRAGWSRNARLDAMQIKMPLRILLGKPYFGR
jgi:glycosyltransferase involved in cell wall biosynthesis